MKIIRSIAVLAIGTAVLTGCGEDAVQDITGPAAGARVKFFNFGVNAPSVNFYANEQKVTAITSATGAESALGVAYGGVGSGGFYSAITPGQYTFSGKIAATVDKDLAVARIPAAIADGKAYSVYTSGFYDVTAKSVEGFVVEDAFSESIDYTVAYVRFVNAISNSSPMTLFARNTLTSTEVALGGSIAYKRAGAFVAVPPGVYDLSTRTDGSAVNAIARTAVSFNAGRVYTIGARGDITVVSTTLANRPILDLTANR